MGAPKQKWTQEEELALKAGVIKHGAGKWHTILKDPEYSCILFLRSNVDLEDKWRNMSVMNNGWTSREKSRLSVRRISSAHRHEEGSGALSFVSQDDDEMDDEPMPLAVVVSNPTMQHITPPKRSIVKLDNLIMEAITNLGEPGGSNKTTIAAYIDVKHRYRIAATSGLSERGNSSMLTPEGTQMISPNIEMEEMVSTKAHFNLNIDKMRTMTLQKAAVAVARSVAEAEAAMLEAEEAVREAAGATYNPTRLDFVPYLVNRLKEGKAGRIFMISYNSGQHWILTIIWENEIYIMDSLARPKTYKDWEKSLKFAVKQFNDETGRGNGKMPTVTLLNGAPKQHGGIECGYYVMRYIKEIVNDDTLSFSTKWGGAKNRKSYTQEELDEVRIEGAHYIETLL